MNDAEDGDGDEHFSQAFDEIKSQGERIASSLEKMQEMQMQQMNCMNQFKGDFLKAFKVKCSLIHIILFKSCVTVCVPVRYRKRYIIKV